jgi:hypothetical protein
LISASCQKQTCDGHDASACDLIDSINQTIIG